MVYYILVPAFLERKLEDKTFWTEG